MARWVDPRFSWLLGMAGVLAAGSAGRALADEPPHDERVHYPSDVEAQFEAITDRADALGFWLEDEQGEAPFDPSLCRHWQGIARSSAPGTPYLFLSRSGNQPPVPCLQWCEDHDLPCTEVGDGPGHLVVVRMASRDDDGERLRSNRLRRGTETADSRPDERDRIVAAIPFAGQGEGNARWPRYGHPGGLQIVGDVLVVPLEAPYESDPAFNEVLFVDVSDPEHPTPIRRLPVEVSDDFTAGLVAVTAQPDGAWLMLLAGLQNREVRFYRSLGSDLHDPALPWELDDTWLPAEEPVSPACELIPPSPQLPNGSYKGWPAGSTFDVAHQSLNFVREGGPAGDLFLLGARATSQVPGLGEDWFDLFRVVEDGDGFHLECVAMRHVHSFPSSDGATLFHNNIAHFAAASGAYVSPAGELILYATEHDNDGPGGSVKLGEWRHVDMARPGSATFDPTVDAGGPYTVPEGGAVSLVARAAPPRTRAWVELWTDPDWRDDRYLVVDQRDWRHDDFDDFEELDDAQNNPFKDGFSDQATSARWFAPTGCDVVLRNNDLDDPDPGDDTRVIAGTGAVGFDAHLGALDDDITAVVFEGCEQYYDPARLSVRWDLDEDGSHEVGGATALLSAAQLDGPAELRVGAEVRHEGDGRTGRDRARVVVTNVAPTLSPLVLRDPAGRTVGDESESDVRFALAHLPLTLTAAFTDPGVADTHTPSIAWGDGDVSALADLDAFEAATGGVTGALTGTHAYAHTGLFPIAVSVIDDDAGRALVTEDVVVLDAAGVIAEVVDALRQHRAGAAGLLAKALTRALAALEGNRGGDAHNGALDALDVEHPLTALVHLASALEWLARAGAAGLDEAQSLSASLALAGYSIAVDTQLDAIAATTPPTLQQAARLEAIARSIDDGASSLAAEEWADALAAFRHAVLRATGLP